MSVKLNLTGNKVSYQPPNDEQTLKYLQKMYTFYKEGKLCDVVLVAGNDNTKIRCHRLVLCFVSEYFNELLDPLPAGDVIIKDVDGDVLRLLIEFFYTLSLRVRSDNAHRIMWAAYSIGLPAIASECEDFIAASMNPTNCLEIAKCSKYDNFSSLYEKALICASRLFEDILKDKSFLRISPYTLRDLVKRNDLNVSSEEVVFRAIVSWMKKDPNIRNMFMDELLCKLRFPLLSPKYIAYEVEKFCQSPESQKLIMKALQWHVAPYPYSVFPPDLSTERNQMSEIIMLKGGDVQKDTTAEIFDPLLGKWETKHWPSKPQLGWHSSGLMVNRKLYLAGTTIKDDIKFSCVDCFDLETRKWTELPAMTSTRFSFGMGIVRGILYVIGGTVDGADSLSTVEKWDPNSPETWESVTSMIAERSRPAVAVLNGLIYALGSNNDFKSNIFEFYDPQTDTWTELAPPEMARTDVELTAVNGCLYAVGGRTEGGICSMVECFNPMTNSWTEITPSQKYKLYQQCTVSLNRLIVLAEHNLSQSMHVLEEYNPETKRWRTLNELDRQLGTFFLVAKQHA